MSHVEDIGLDRREKLLDQLRLIKDHHMLTSKPFFFLIKISLDLPLSLSLFPSLGD